MTTSQRLTIMTYTLAGLIIHTTTAMADSAWRCAQSDCPESLINDIEDIITRDWPSFLIQPSHGVTVRCADFADNCPHCAQGPIREHVIPFSLALVGNLRSFLIGRYTADASYVGTVRTVSGPLVDGMRIFNELWNDTAIDYSFAVADTEVPSHTGVLDLGAVNFSTATGKLWTTPFHVVVDMTGYEWCSIGEDRFVGGGSTATHIFSVPWNNSGLSSSIAAMIRDQFRRAVRVAVTGSP